MNDHFLHVSYFLCFTPDDLIKVHKFKPTIKWRQSFENYLKTMPPYYIGVSGLIIILQLFINHFFINIHGHCCTVLTDIVLFTVLKKGFKNHGSTKPVG